MSISTCGAARLDRALCDDTWRRLFPSARVRHMLHGHSDHCSLLLELEEGRTPNLGLRPFRFKATWMTDPEFEAMMKKAWNGEVSLPHALKDLSVKLRAWNADTFGNIFRRKRRNELRLGGFIGHLQRVQIASSC